MVDAYISYALVFLLSLSFLFSFRPHIRHRRLPPSPIGLPIIGHLHLLGPILHQSFQKLSARHGPIISLRLGSIPCVVIATADAAKDFFKTHEHAFLDRPNSKAINYFTYDNSDFVFQPCGLYWSFIKKLCMSELLGGHTLDQLRPVRRDERVDFLRGLFKKAKEREAVDVGSELMKFTNNVICRMATGRACFEMEEEADDLRKMVGEISEIIGKFNVTDYIWFCRNLDLQGFNKRLESIRGRFDRMIEEMVKKKEAERRKKGGGHGGAVKDLLDILLDVMEDEKAEMRLTRENIKAFILNIFLAGTDTSAITMEWALGELINHPEVMRKAREEIDTMVGKARLVEESDIPSLPYLQAIVKETLRLHPAGPLIFRKSSKNCTVGTYNIPTDTTLFVNVWAIGRDPTQWPEPLEFRPERFIENEKLTRIEMAGQHYQLLPFGSGRRGCPGRSLALQMVQPTLGAMIQCFEWEVAGGGPVDMAERSGLTLMPASPLVCTPVLRLDSTSLAL